MEPHLITPAEVQQLVEQLLKLPTDAWRPPFQKMARRYQAELAKTFKAYQIAQAIQLPNRRPALQTQAYRLDLVQRKISRFMALLTPETVQRLKNSNLLKGNQDHPK